MTMHACRCVAFAEVDVVAVRVHDGQVVMLMAFFYDGLNKKVASSREAASVLRKHFDEAVQNKTFTHIRQRGRKKQIKGQEMSMAGWTMPFNAHYDAGR